LKEQQLKAQQLRAQQLEVLTNKEHLPKIITPLSDITRQLTPSRGELSRNTRSRNLLPERVLSTNQRSRGLLPKGGYKRKTIKNTSKRRTYKSTELKSRLV
jgi:hypothetical protein